MNHGTNGAYQMHLRRGDEVCEACRAAHVAYAESYRKTQGETLVVKRRRWSAARRRALSELAKRYPEDYQELRLAALRKIPR